MRPFRRNELCRLTGLHLIQILTLAANSIFGGSAISPGFGRIGSSAPSAVITEPTW
jgi:hypothetical protein